MLADMFMRTYASAQVKRKSFYRKSELKMFLLVSGGHTFDSHSDPIFKELELLKLSDIRHLELGKLMFSLNHSLLPSSSTIIFL